MNTETMRPMKKVSLNRLATVLLVLFGLPGTAQVLTLDSVLRIVDRQHPMLQEYDQRAEAQRAYTAGAKGWMAPMVGVGTFMTPYPGQTVEDANRGSLMISVEQNIPNPAKLNANERYISSRAAVESQTRAVKYNLLRAEAKNAYYEWLVADEKLSILSEGEAIIEVMLKLARIRYPYNQGTLGTIYKTEGRLYEIQNMKLMAQSEREKSKATLRALMNMKADVPLMIDSGLQVRFTRHSLQSDTSILRTQRSDVRQLEQTIQVMRLNQELQAYQSRPEFRLRFDHMQPLGSGMPTQFTAMAMVSIPIAPWSSKMYKSEVNGMRYDIEAMKRGQEAILLEARGMLTGMAVQIEKMEQQLENYRTKIIPALRRNYEASMAAYEENRETLLIVVDGWEAMNMAQITYTEKLAEYYDMIVRYEKEVER